MKKCILSAIVLIFVIAKSYSQEVNVKKIDSFITHIESHNKGIGAVSVFKDDKELYNRSFGQKNLKDNQAGAGNLKYHIGSITKLLTATMIFQLIEKGQLNLDNRLSSYYPEIPNSSNICIKHLLNHTSGLGNFVVKHDSLSDWLKQPVAESDIFNEIIRQGISFQPGDSVSYSNSGYYLLTKILEKEYKKNYKEILAENIISKLGLKNTYSTAPNDAYNCCIAKSYQLENGTWKEIEEFYFPNVSGVGDVVSTPKDLNLFITALFSGKLLLKESIENIKPAVRQLFGHGLMRIPLYNITFYGHNGDTYGTHSVVAYNEQDKVSLSYIINGEYYPNNDIAIGLLSIISNKSYEFPAFTVYSVNFENYSKYEGIYRTEKLPIRIKVFREGNMLKAQASGQSPFTLEPFAEHEFRNDKAGIKIKFMPKESKMLLVQGDKYEFTKEK